MECALQKAGFSTLNLDYSSRQATCEALAQEIARRADTFLYGGGEPQRSGGLVHIVGHSLGGLLARAVVTRRRPPALSRVVLLGPPNSGSEIADLLHRNWLYRYLLGPAALQLVTNPAESLALLLGPVTFELGVIAGDRALDPIGYLLLPGPNDGRVCVARTRLDGMADHIVLHTTHALMMRNPQVISQTIHFLRHGCFERPEAGSRAPPDAASVRMPAGSPTASR
jgi:pimeloyl-ACP methyl ester carboxylesterase